MTIRQWFMVLLFALAAHILLFSMFRPLPLDISESSNEDRYTLFLEEETLARKGKDPYGLHYWLRYTDPERLLKPDFEAGFSLICGKKEAVIPSPDQFCHGLFPPHSAYSSCSMPGSTCERNLAEFIRGTEIPVFPHKIPEKEVLEKIQYPVWTDESGRITSGLFLPDAASLRLMRQEHAEKPAVFRLTLHKDAFPTVEILRSCGNPKLDMLAARQLKARRENFNAGIQPATKYFTVVWEMPTLKTIHREKP